MKRVLSVFFVLLLLFTTCTSFAQENQSVPYEEVENYVKRCFDKRKIVGGAVVISYKGNIVFEMPYGKRNARDLVDMETRFRIASVTKMVSAVGLMQLYEQGLVQLDEPLDKVLPFKVFNPYFENVPITLRQVLSHTSSIASSNYYWPKWDHFKKGTKYMRKDAKPGESYQYSNLNGGLIGSTIEALSNVFVNTYMQQNVFFPLGIDAGYAPQFLQEQNNVSYVYNKDHSLAKTTKYYVKDSEKYTDEAKPQEHLAITVGSLFVSPLDLTKLMIALLNGGEKDGVRILSKETVELMEKDQNTLQNSSVTGESKYGLGLSRVSDLEGGTWYGHQGMIHGLTANAFYQKETQLTVVVIGNGYHAYKKGDTVSLARDIMALATDYALKGTWDKVMSK